MQIVRIYSKSGGLSHSFRPHKLTAEQIDGLRAQYPESRYNWLH